MGFLGRASDHTTREGADGRSRRPRLMALGAAAALTLMVSCSSDDGSSAPDSTETTATTVAAADDADQTTTTTTTSSSTSTTGEGAAGDDSPVGDNVDGGAVSTVSGATAALTTAAAEVPNGEPFDLEHSDATRDDTDDEHLWEVKVASDGDEYKIRVGLDGAAVLNSEKQDSPDDDVDKVAQADVDMVTALKTAAEGQSGELDEMEIDTADDGTIVWEVEFEEDGDDTKVIVDATSGDIIDG